MRTRVIPLEDGKVLPEAARVIQSGELIAFPTDTLYGLGSSAYDSGAVDRLYQVKERPYTKALPILIGDLDELDSLAAGVTTPVQRLLHTWWPGPLTVILRQRPGLPENISPSPTVGIRLPDLTFTRNLLRTTGPLAVTSANLSGRPGARSATEVLEDFQGKIPLILDGGPSPGGTASTVVDCSQEEWSILRVGPISERQIIQAAQG